MHELTKLQKCHKQTFPYILTPLMLANSWSLIMYAQKME